MIINPRLIIHCTGVRISFIQRYFGFHESDGMVAICVDFVGNDLNGTVVVNFATRDDSATCKQNLIIQ